MQQHSLLQSRHSLTNGTLSHDYGYRHGSGAMYQSMIALLLALVPLLLAVAFFIAFLHGN